MSESRKSNKDILQAPRGMRDFYGENFNLKKNFYTQAEAIAERYGFMGMETPIMEHTEIFHKGVGAGTDIVDKEMYTLETAGGDHLTLRPEGTAAIVRSYIENGMGSLPQPVSVYYSGPFFRHEKPQKGRYRQFYQFGLEIMGSKNSFHDVLTIQTGYEIVKTSGKNIIVGINTLGSNKERQKYIEILRAFYTENIDQIAKSDQRRIQSNPLRILDSKEISTKKLNKKAPILMDSLSEESKEYFQTVLTGLDALDIHYEVMPSLVRGLDYYEHTVFEYIIRDTEGNNSHALGGGGRYDGLAEMIGHNSSIPAVGLALGVDRILEVSNKDVFEKINKRLVSCISLSEKAHAKMITIASNNNLPTINFHFGLSDSKIGKLLSKAEQLNAHFALILGDDELEKNVILLKNLENQEQREISIDDIGKELEL